MTSRSASCLLPVFVLVLGIGACAAPLRRTRAPSEISLSELWMPPRDIGSRDLFFGPGGERLAPAAGATYRVRATDTEGFSPGYDVVDAKGREWDVKLGPEAQTEVVASRLLWAVGFHQPVTYYVTDWRAHDAAEPIRTEPGRFLLSSAFTVEGIWDWRANPFVGSRPYRALLIVNVLLNNWDLKNTNNLVYRAVARGEGPRRWFVVQDLGASLGETRGIVHGTRNDVAGFRGEGFVAGVEGGRVKFVYHGKSADLLQDVTVEDVVWTCELLNRLTDRQWADAFRAAGYDPTTSAQYIATIRDKIAQGQNLGS